jgi:hypothetical protein
VLYCRAITEGKVRLVDEEEGREWLLLSIWLCFTSEFVANRYFLILYSIFWVYRRNWFIYFLHLSLWTFIFF